MNRNTKEKWLKNRRTVRLITNKMLLSNNLIQFTTTMLGRFLFRSVFLIDLKNTYHKQIFLRCKASTLNLLLNNNLRKKLQLRWRGTQFVKKLVMLKNMTFQMFKQKTECRTSSCTTKIDLHSN